MKEQHQSKWTNLLVPVLMLSGAHIQSAFVLVKFGPTRTDHPSQRDSHSSKRLHSYMYMLQCVLIHNSWLPITRATIASRMWVNHYHSHGYNRVPHNKYHSNCIVSAFPHLTRSTYAAKVTVLGLCVCVFKEVGLHSRICSVHFICGINNNWS